MNKCNFVVRRALQPRLPLQSAFRYIYTGNLAYAETRTRIVHKLPFIKQSIHLRLGTYKPILRSISNIPSAMDVKHAEQQLDELLCGVYDATSEGDGPRLTSFAQDVSASLEAHSCNTTAVVKQAIFGDKQRPMEPEEQFQLLIADEIDPTKLRMSLQYIPEDGNEQRNSDEHVQEQMTKILQLLQGVSMDGSIFKYAVRRGLYEYGIVTLTKDKFVFGWRAAGVVWT